MADKPTLTTLDVLTKRFSTGRVPTGNDFSSLIQLADAATSALPKDDKPVAGLLLKDGKLDVATPLKSPLAVTGGVLGLQVDPAHLNATGEKLDVQRTPKKGLAADGLSVQTADGIDLNPDGSLGVRAGAGLSKDAVALTVNRGKGLSGDTTLTVKAVPANGIELKDDKLRLKIHNKDPYLIQTQDGLSLTDEGIRKLTAGGVNKLRQALNDAIPGEDLGAIQNSEYATISQCLAALKKKGFDKTKVVKNVMLMVPDMWFRPGEEKKFSLKKADGSIVPGQDGSNGAYVCDTVGVADYWFKSIGAGFCIAIGSVTAEGNYAKPDTAQITQNALLLYVTPSKEETKMLGWWDLEKLLPLLAQAEPGNVYVDTAGWHATFPVAPDAHAPWEPSLAALYDIGASYHTEIDKLKIAFNNQLKSIRDKGSKTPPVASVRLDSRGYVILRTDHGEVMGEFALIDNSGQIWAPIFGLEGRSNGCYLVWTTTTADGRPGNVCHTKNALVVNVRDQGPEIRDKIVSVLGQFTVNPDHTVGDWVPFAEVSPAPGLHDVQLALTERLKSLTAGRTITYENPRINVSAGSGTGDAGQLYYGKDLPYPPESLSACLFGAKELQPVIKKIAEWADGWYAVVGKLTADNKPDKAGTKYSANAVLLGKFGDMISVAGYWDLAAGAVPVWYQTEPDPVLYPTVRPTTFKVKFDDKEEVADGGKLTRQIQQAGEKHKFTIIGGSGEKIIWQSAKPESATVDPDGLVTFKQWDYAFNITATRPASRRYNKSAVTLKLEIQPLGTNEIKSGTLLNDYYKDNILELNHWLSTVKTDAGTTIEWSSSKTDVLTIENGIADAKSGFTSAAITLTAKVAWTHMLRKDEKQFSFTFHEHSRASNDLQVVKAIVYKPDAGAVKIEITLTGGNSNQPELTQTTAQFTLNYVRTRNGWTITGTAVVGSTDQWIPTLQEIYDRVHANRAKLDQKPDEKMQGFSGYVHYVNPEDLLKPSDLHIVKATYNADYQRQNLHAWLKINGTRTAKTNLRVVDEGGQIESDFKIVNSDKTVTWDILYAVYYIDGFKGVEDSFKNDYYVITDTTDDMKGTRIKIDWTPEK